MTWMHIFWDLSPAGNAEHVAEHGLGVEEVEHVLMHPEQSAVSRKSRRPIVFGHTPSGQYIAVVYEEFDEDTIYPITAFPIEERS